GDRVGEAGVCDLAVGVVGGGGLAQPDGGGVGLVRPDDVGQQPGGAVDADHQHTGGVRVQGAGVTDFAGAGQLTDAPDDVVAGPAGRLVHQDDAGADCDLFGALPLSHGCSAPPALTVVGARAVAGGVDLGGVGGCAVGGFDHRCGAFALGAHRSVLFAGLLQQVLQVGGRLRDLVGDELQGRGQPDAQLPAQGSAQPSLVGAQQLLDLCLGLLVRGEHGVVDRGVLQVVGDAGVGDGDHFSALVLDGAAQGLSDDHLHPRGLP